jgi:hypothetical protein
MNTASENRGSVRRSNGAVLATAEPLALRAARSAAAPVAAAVTVRQAIEDAGAYFA